MLISDRLRIAIDRLQPVVRDPGEPVVAGMATLPSRAATFPKAFASIIRQVDRLYLYCDGHREVPEPARGDPRVVPVLSDEMPGLHANGKLIGVSLERHSCVFVATDDDIYYPRNFVGALRAGLAIHGDRAVVGYHGSLLARPLARYNDDRTVFSYHRALEKAQEVDLLGTGAAMFCTRFLNFDVRRWTFTNMVDLGLALEAAKAGLPMMCLARKKRRVIMLAKTQPDSIRAGLLEDDARQTELGRELLRLRATKPPGDGARA
jgi:hypothetical protein